MAVDLAYCSGVISTDVNGEAICSTNWQTVDLESYVATAFDNHLLSHPHDMYQPLTADDWNDLWPLILLLMVSAVGIRMLLRLMDINAGRSG